METTTATRNADVQRLRAFVETQKRAVQAAEARYDIPAAVAELRQLSAPLCDSTQFPSSWKHLYLELLYRDVAAFVLGFVAVHLEVCFSELDRQQVFDVFFDRQVVPASKSIAALAATLAATKTKTTRADRASEQDTEASIAQCVRLLATVIDADGIEDIVAAMKQQELQAGKNGRSAIGQQVLVSQLASLPDLVYNRRQRETPSLFRPRRYFPRLCDALFRAFLRQDAVERQRWLTFRLFADKLSRIGQMEAFVQSWLDALRVLPAEDHHRVLLQSLPEFCYEQFLLQLAKTKAPETSTAAQALSQPKYRLLALIPPTLAASQQLQYVIAHKLLLRKPVGDLFYWRAVADALAGDNLEPCNSPLADVFDVVLARWSQTDFAATADYTVDASVSFFLRYALQQLAVHDDGAVFSQCDWVPKLCKGVQDHMGHSLERVRVLGMRVGESLSLVISTEKPLDFGLDEKDPLAVYGHPVSPTELAESLAALDLDADVAGEDDEPLQSHSGSGNGHKSRRKREKKTITKPFALDPDELVLSDDESGSESEVVAAWGSESDADSDSDSDMSLEAYDLQDDEEDLTAKRPMYLKDLVAGLLVDEDREKTEVALAEAEHLLRRRPRDLQDKVYDVVRALLRLEDKYNTTGFVRLRSQALATACALAPTQTLPYLQRQALEREQLLQSRIDSLQAMVSAAQELSERGGGEPKPLRPKTLLQEPTARRSEETSDDQDDLETHTMQSLKTRRWGYRRDPLAAPKKNAFGPYALTFFSPLLFGYIEYMRAHTTAANTKEKPRSDVEQTFLAHLLHALASFVECAGQAPQTVAMAKCLLEFAWSERTNASAEVRRQVLFGLSRVLLVVPPALLRQEMGDGLAELSPWLLHVQQQDADAGCREAAGLLLSFASIPTIPFSLT